MTHPTPRDEGDRQSDQPDEYLLRHQIRLRIANGVLIIVGIVALSVPLLVIWGIASSVAGTQTTLGLGLVTSGGVGGVGALITMGVQWLKIRSQRKELQRLRLQIDDLQGELRKRNDERSQQ